MKRWLCWIALVALLPLGKGWSMDALRFGIESDVPLDGRAVAGTLANGLHSTFCPTVSRPVG